MDPYVRRQRVIAHIEDLTRSPAWFLEQVEQVMELAAAGRTEERVEFNGRRRETVGQIVEDWELEKLVQLQKDDAFRPPEEPEWDDLHASWG
ncbi:MAG: hypothetical protein ACR2K6_02375 [Solirubrobacterales bacterium]